MTTTVFVEGVFDQLLIQRLLSDLHKQNGLRIKAAGGRDAARPRARKELLVSRQPVALVLDADTTDPTRVQQQQRDLEDYLSWGAQGLPFRVIQFTPELEVVFFNHPEVLTRIFDRKPDEMVILAGQAAPRHVLTQLLQGHKVPDRIDLIKMLTDADLDVLREDRLVAELRSFVEDHAN